MRRFILMSCPVLVGCWPLIPGTWDQYVAVDSTSETELPDDSEPPDTEVIIEDTDDVDTESPPDTEPGPVDTEEDSEDTADTDIFSGYEVVSIYDLQMTSIDEFSNIILENVIVTASDSLGFYASEPEGGTYSGIYVYNGFDVGLEPGDIVTISGYYEEYAGIPYAEFQTHTEIVAEEVFWIGNNGTIAPIIMASNVGNSLDTAEPYESCYVQISDPLVTDGQNDFGDWMVDDVLRVSSIYVYANPNPGDRYSAIRGIVDYHDDYFYVAPMSEADLIGYLPIEDEIPEDTGDMDDSEVGALIITEIMFNPNIGPDAGNEWIEVYNTTDTAIHLSGLTVQDDDGNADNSITTSYLLPAGGYAVIAIGGGSSDSWLYTSFLPQGWYGSEPALSNLGDWLSISLNGIIQDKVTISTISNAGHSLQLHPSSYHALANNEDGAWCAGESWIEASDYGTPGSVNQACF